ncbi:KptA family-domain-containing protein [Aspergillus avenaceus]|uniref:2'-phosphotransferase n=1 Tax=Aspergillus avenaceus TaxID=36643 RepID=A0A5N6TIE0_ASPAV|nr:KptA family-domain-containing protein [Aspergillus avenaceus]
MSQQCKGRGSGGRDVTVSKALSLLLRHAAEKEGLKVDAQGYANVADVLAWRKLKSLKVTLPEIVTAVSTSDKKRFALLHIPSAEAQQATTTSEPIGDQDPTSPDADAIPTTSAGQDDATATALSVSDTDPSHFLIRATQGHSIKSVDAASFQEKLTLEDESKLPDTVVHGTFHTAWPLILASGGLRVMGRNQVHFATGPSLESVLAQTAAGPQGSSGDEGPKVISGMRRDAQVLIYIDLKKALAAGCPFWRSENGVILSDGMLSEGNASDPTQKFVPVEFFDVVVERKRGLGKIWERGQELQALPEELLKKGNPKGRRTGVQKGKDRPNEANPQP